jgi:endonuclease-3 related protein
MSAAPINGKGSPAESLRQYYETLLTTFGPQGWWPARTRWEVICGAILTQNTTWQNAALAIGNLRKAKALSLRRMQQVSQPELEALIRPAGFFRQKARALRNVADWIDNAHGGSLSIVFAQDPEAARARLLALNGIGPETADAILLYAGGHPTFVADAYTRRILSRHGLIPASANYDETREFLHRHLPREEDLYNEFHALLVETAKRHCRKNEMNCDACPLGVFVAKSAETSRSEVRAPLWASLAG